MKKILLTLTAMVMAVPVLFGADDTFTVSDLAVKGRIDEENITFDLNFKANVKKRNSVIPLVSGDVAHLESSLPRKSELWRQGETFYLTVPGKGKQKVDFRFASRALKDGLWREATFTIPASSIRRLSVVCDRDDLEIVFPGALNVEKKKNDEGLTEVTAFLGLSNEFAVRWKPTVKKLAGDLVVTCDANTIASSSVGAMKIDNLFTYRVVQGTLKQLSFALPQNLSVTQVMGEDIQDWLIEDDESGPRRLAVTLSRPKETLYKLQVESEVVLPKFPCELDVPVITPENVIRSSGFLMIGTDSAIKLLVDKALGLTQVDQTSFPAVALDVQGVAARVQPTRSKFAYQYANMPYTLSLSADDIVPEFSSDEQLVLSVSDNDLVFSASVELDVRDAPAREIVIRADSHWIVANVSGRSLSDYDVRDTDDGRAIHLYFRDAVMGRTVVEVRLERSLSAEDASFSAPVFKVEGTKTERGYIVLAAEKGLRLAGDRMDGLREVHTGSVEARVPGAQLAYRFKEEGWSLGVLLERTTPTIHSEAFHLVSIGEGVLYCSAAITYHIDGAPVRTFKVAIPEEFQNVEFTGRDIRNWEHEGGLWTIFLQEKVIGDYTLGFTYDRQFAYEGKDTVSVGGVRTIGTTTEAGYIVLASSASLSLALREKDDSIIKIERDEVPEEYLLMVNDPVLQAYKYAKLPHGAQLTVKRYDTEQLLDQVADRATLYTEISKDGEAVTTATYFLKNVSQQYLVMRLPEDARIWSARCGDGQGNMKVVKPMSRENENLTLVPVERLRDPNIPMRVELVYAQSMKKLGALGSSLKFEAPGTVKTHNAFAEWVFTLPEGYSVAHVGGNMTLESASWLRGVLTVMVDTVRLYKVVFRHFLVLVLFGLVCLICACSLAKAIGRRRGVAWRAIVSAVILMVLFVVTLGIQFGLGARGFGAFVQVLMDNNANQGGSVAVTKTVSLAGTRTLETELRIVPAWIGPNSSFGFFVMAMIAGLALVVVSGSGRNRNLTLTALGLTALTFGFSEVVWGRFMLISALALIIPIVLAVLLIRGSYRRGCRKREALALAGPADISYEMPPPFEDVPAEPEDETSDGSEGSSSIACLLALACLGLLFTAVRADQLLAAGPRELPVMKSVVMNVQAPKMDEESEKSARVVAELEFEVEETGEFVLLRPPAVLTEYELGSSHLSVRPSAQGYLLSIDRAGTYKVKLTYSVPTAEHEGAWFMGVDMPPNLRNSVDIEIPEKELDIESPDAVLLQASEEDGVSKGRLVYGSSVKAHISWRPRARKTKLEKVVFFCEVNTVATFEPGVVDMMNLVRYQIAQGEMKSMTLEVPAGMSVTAVRAPGLSTWRFDPDARLLEAILEKPVSGDLALFVSSQIGCEGLPYDAQIGTLGVTNAVRQRGSIAFAAPDTVQVQVNDTVGLNPMNIEDVSPDAVQAARQARRARREMAVKRAFRYHSLPVSASIHAERVLPEIRIVENASLSVSDERVLLSTRLDLTVNKAGIFSLRLGIPEGFDVETLTGQDISHWDEVEAGADGKGRGVVVHFRKQALGTRAINVVMARTEKGLGDVIDVPRVSAENAFKHTGTLVVSGERGVRMMTVEKEGVSEINPRELGIREVGVLAFNLLRPEWLIRLRTEVVEPTVRSDVLQRVDLSEGMMQCIAYVEYRIDNAGTKVFRIQAPMPGVALAVTGREIAKVHELDKEKGIWEVELHNKAESKYSMQVRYQLPFAGGEKVSIMPLKTLDVESQKGYLVVMLSDRVQVSTVGSQGGLKLEGARTIPGDFGAGDLSDAICCYRTIGGDYQLDLSVVRHKTAEILPAQVNSVRMKSVVSDGGQVLTHAVLDMTVGDLSFLPMTLADKGSSLWSAFVNGKSVAVSREGDMYRIPLEESVPGETNKVEITYSSDASSGWFSNKQKFVGPKFGLPSKDIEWTFYVVPGQNYYGFGGTMEHVKMKKKTLQRFGLEEYSINNLRLIEDNLWRARQSIAQSEELVKKGQQKQARRVLESAVNYSQNDAAFNEDARIQFKNLAEQQAMVGLVQRRDKMRFGQNIQDVGQLERIQDFQEGNFTAEYAQKVEQSLSEREKESLRTLADKIMDQQFAAERVAQAINVTLPEHGRKLSFRRSIQIDPDADMTVVYKVGSGALLRWLLALVTGVVFVIVYRSVLGWKRV